MVLYFPFEQQLCVFPTQQQTKGHFSTESVQSDTITSCQLQSTNKRQSDSREKQKQGRPRRRGETDKWGKMYCSCELMKETKQGTRRPQLLLQSNSRERPYRKRTQVGQEMVKKQGGFADWYILDHLLNTKLIWRNISVFSQIKNGSKAATFL